MALQILSPREVQTAADGDHADGGGLMLRVRGTRANWVFRFTAPDGRRRDAGFGTAHRSSIPAAGESLRLARERARHARDMLAAGVDPLEKKQTDRRTAAEEVAAKKTARKMEATTLARCAREYHGRAIEPNMNAKYSAVWIASLENHVPQAIWHKPIAEITPVALFEALAKVKRTRAETADRVRRRLAAVFDDAIFFGRCALNPANAIRRKMGEVAASSTGDRHYRALAYVDVPEFVAHLRQNKGIAARALEFALLTASRTGEVVGAVWGEIDVLAAIWRIPAERMKGGDEHVVHLTARALGIISEMRKLGSVHVFPSPTNPQRPLSNMAMLTLLRRMKYETRTTVHGVCRASFSTWANDLGVARVDVIEAALAHREADRVRAAYNRASFAVERAALLQAWADYCAEGKLPALGLALSAPVISIARAA